MSYGAEDTIGWGEVITPGSGDAVYIEDCTFSKYNQSDPYFVGYFRHPKLYGGERVAALHL